MNAISIERPTCALCGNGYVIRRHVCENCRQQFETAPQLLEALQAIATNLSVPQSVRERIALEYARAAIKAAGG